MAMTPRGKFGISGMLSDEALAPPSRDAEPKALEAVPVPQPPKRRRYAEPEPEWDDPEELEEFDFDPSEALVRPRRRKAVEYPTLRVHPNTAKVMRQVWLANRRIDPALSFTEFSTLCVQFGLRALKEARDRGGQIG